MAPTPEPSNAALSSASFQVAEAYEHLMGRWSRRLAPLLIKFGGLDDGDRVVDVGCGTGSLTFALPMFASVAAVTGIDITEPYVASARARNTDSRITIDLGDARALPYADASFDRAYSSLVLHFIPHASKAVSEMCRVVRPGGTVTAAVWDNYGGQPFTRILWDIAARETLRQHMRRAYVANRPDGPRSMASVAWACRGRVPE